ncbi:MAG: PKD domain-containing protein [Bacteroidota bacterium]
MKRTGFTRSILFLIALIFAAPALRAQVTVTSSDSLSCSVLCTTLTATVNGDSPIDAGITSDDIYSPLIPIGFIFNYYGINYNSLVIGANGTLSFDATDAGAGDPWPITAPLLGNASKFNNICGPWVDIDIFSTGSAVGTETYSTSGVAPFRRFAVSWCGCSMFSCTAQRTTTQIIIFETTNVIEVHLSTKPVCAGWNGGRAIIGVQNATGTDAVCAPGRDFPAVWTNPPSEGWRFVPSGTTYAVTSIPYAPIPYASSLIYWYNTTTGAYLGTGTTLIVCPTTTTTYAAGALGCADTSFGYYTVTPGGSITLTSTFTNPTRCGGCDGTITLSGMTPGAGQVINYSMGGVPQPPVSVTASAAGTVTLTGLCANSYTGITTTQGTCTSIPISVTLTDPAINISSVTPADVSFCGLCDGSLVLHGLYPSRTYTVNYTFNGVPQPPVSTATNGAGNITLTGLCEGTYASIVASFGTCITPPVGPYNIGSPTPPPGRVFASTNPTECGRCDGTITLKGLPPFSADTVRYSRNGIPQTAVITSALGDSTIFLPGLCNGSFTGFSVKIGNCIYPVTGSATLVAPPLTAWFDTAINPGCTGDSVMFTNMSSSAGPLYYIWNFGDGKSDTVTNPLHVYPQGTYTVTLFATNHFCIDSLKTTLVLEHPINAAFAASPLIVCQGSPVTFSNSSTGANITYQWHFGDGGKDTAKDPAYIFYNSGSYNAQVVITDNIPCSDTASIYIIVDTISGLQQLVSDTALCQGTYVTFNGLYADMGNTGVSWNFGDGDSILNKNPVTHSFNTEGVYTVSVTPHFRACRDTTAFRTITVIRQPQISLGPDTAICIGSEALTLRDELNASNPAATWVWSNGSRISASTITAPGAYYAIVTINSCSASDTVIVASDCYMNIPNVFSPNGDGVNDYFYPRSLLSRGLTAFNMNIYNRWGQLIFETTSLNGAGWDGKLNGVPQPQGVFVYVIDATFRDGQKEHHQGNVTLIR